jgi:polar amino acid transport system substrate-binding protein
MLFLRHCLLALFVLASCCAWPTAALADTLDDIRQRGELTWGTDLEGGAPYVIPDPADPDKSSGFETEIGHAIAKELGVKGRLIHGAWDGLVPALERRTFDMVMNGLEITPERQTRIIFSRPYYVYTQQIVVREGTRGIATLDDLKGKRVGTLGATAAEQLLKQVGGVEIKIYPSSVQPYDDLRLGRLDAVLQDLPIAVNYGRRDGLVFAGEPFGEGYYAIGFRKGDDRLKTAVDGAIKNLLERGELKRILDRYGLWNQSQQRLFTAAPVLAVVNPAPAVAPTSFWEQLKSSAPLLWRGTLTTVTISVLAMGLAIFLGIIIAVMRLYGPKPLAFLAAAYVEVFRGTPLLVQLFLIYYGLPTVGIQLDAFVAAILGLGLNYAAYEGENYRAGLLAIPKGQMEAALALGMNKWQALRHILLPQSFRIVIPPVTNDFIALFKDSSVISVIALVELTKAYGMMASATYNYIGFGLITAAIYFAISYPTSLFARWVENRLRVA